MTKAFLLLGLSAVLAVTASAQKVSVSATAGAAKSGKVPVTVTIKIPEGYHIYSSKAAETGIPTSVKSKTAAFKVASASYPPTKPFTTLGETVQVYEGKTVIKLMLAPTKKLSGKQTVQLAVTSQACNDRTCMPPDTQVVTVSFKL